MVVLLNLGLSWAPSWHYAVVIGYDLDRPPSCSAPAPSRRQLLPFETFEQTWARGGNWAFVVLPPGRLAATSADEAQTTHALVAFEKTALPLRAATAYRSALARWPGSLTIAMGLGNTSTSRRPARAETVFKPPPAATTRPPPGTTWPACCWSASACREARDAAQKAVALGGPTLDAARDTLQQIEARLASPPARAANARDKAARRWKSAPLSTRGRDGARRSGPPAPPTARARQPTKI